MKLVSTKLLTNILNILFSHSEICRIFVFFRVKNLQKTNKIAERLHLKQRFTSYLSFVVCS